MESEERIGTMEAELCETCHKIHVTGQCGTDLMEEEDAFILEFEQLPADEHIQRLRKTVQQLRDDRWMATSQAQKYRQRLITISKKLPHMKEEISREKYAMSKLKATAQLHHRQLQDEFKAVCGVIRDVTERLSLTLTCDGSCVYMREDYEKLKGENVKLQATERELKLRISSLEARLELTSKEAEAISLHAKNKDMNTDQKLSKLQKDLALRESELKILKKDYMVSQRRVEEETEKVSQTQIKANKLLNEIDRFKALLKHSQDEAQRLLHERKAAIEELEKLKMEMEEKDKQVSKIQSGVKDNVDSEMMKMMKDMDEYQTLMEKRVQEKSEKEREKIKKELEQYVTEYRANETKLMAKMKAQTEKHKDSILRLNHDLQEAKSNAAMRERDLQVQLKQLQAYMANSGSKTNTPLPQSHTPLPDLLREKETEIRTLSNEIQFFKDKVHELQAYIERLKRQQSDDGKVEMLEGLVHKEVEERNQLLKSFSKARRELNKYKNGDAAKDKDSDESVNLESLLAEDEKRHKPRDMSAIESLTIYRKRSEDRYKPSESSAMDLSDLQQGGSVFTKSVYGSEYRSEYPDLAEDESEYQKSVKTDASGVTGRQRYSNTAKSTKSMKSLKSLQNYYNDRDLGKNGNATAENDGKMKKEEEIDMKGDTVSPLQSKQTPAHLSKPTPPEFRSPDAGPRNQHKSNLKSNVPKTTKPQSHRFSRDRAEISNADVVGTEENVLDALGRIASGSNPERVPQWANRNTNGPATMHKFPLKDSRFTRGTGALTTDGNRGENASTTHFRNIQRSNNIPSNIENLFPKSTQQPNAYHSAREFGVTNDNATPFLPRDTGIIGRSDGFLELTRSSPTIAANLTGANKAAVNRQRIAMMNSVQQGNGRRTDESAWKIYQQLRVGKQ